MSVELVQQIDYSYSVPLHLQDEKGRESLLTREWLVTNGLGGYASGSLSGVITRRYHGLLVAALPAPLGRIVMLTQLWEELRLPGGVLVQLAGQERPGDPLTLDWAKNLAEFRLESGLPVWRYQAGDAVLEKRIVVPNRQNTVHVLYTLLEAKGEVRLRLRPFMRFRPHEGFVGDPFDRPYTFTACANQLEINAEKTSPERGEPLVFPPLRMYATSSASAFVLDGGAFDEVFYRVEHARGYEARGRLWTPGYFRFNLREGEQASVTASTHDWDTILALDSQQAWDSEIERRRRLLATAEADASDSFRRLLIFAADQFIIAPNTRVADVARARAAGDEFRTIIAGYHWFTDWGRDTMISLEGLALRTGRAAEAGYILRTFAHYIRDGLIPNMFPEGEREGLYHTADATLWYFHALHRYLQTSGDRATLQLLLPKLIDIFERHVSGTRFGIRVDPTDGLLTQGAEGYQLTWMDAKVGDWVVTPRRGKAVEINALWYNACRLLEAWLLEEGFEEQAQTAREQADKAYASFNQRFWRPDVGYLYDVIDGPSGDEPCLRPNQLFSISLDHPVLQTDRWAPVLEATTRRLLTPVGLRSLAPGDPNYKPNYDGDLRARDAAYHQGTVWAWLIGPFVDAWLKVHPDDFKTAHGFIEGFVAHLNEAAVGSISEIFDAEEPFTPRGCIAQAWSVAEALRCLVKTEGGGPH